MYEPITVHTTYKVESDTNNVTIESWPEETTVDLSIIQQCDGSISIRGEVHISFDNADALYEIVGIEGYSSLKLRLKDGRIYG